MLGCVIGVSDAAARETEGLGSGVDIRIGLMMDSIFGLAETVGDKIQSWYLYFLCRFKSPNRRQHWSGFVLESNFELLVRFDTVQFRSIVKLIIPLF